MVKKEQIRKMFNELTREGWDPGPASDLIQLKYPNNKDKIVTTIFDDLFFKSGLLPSSKYRRK